MANKLNLKDIKSFLKNLLKNPLFYVLIGIFVLDIITKWIMVLYFNFKETGKEFWLIPNFICVTLKFNTGAIFGIGDGKIWSRVVLILIRLLLSIVIPIIYYFKGRHIKKRYKVCLLMIYAGCIGNLVDGLFYWKNICGFDGVVDWIKFSFFDYIFNLADSYITVAVFLIIIFFIVDEIIEIIKRNKRGAYTLTPEEYEKKMMEENKKKNDNQNS